MKIAIFENRYFNLKNFLDLKISRSKGFHLVSNLRKSIFDRRDLKKKKNLRKSNRKIDEKNCG